MLSSVLAIVVAHAHTAEAAAPAPVSPPPPAGEISLRATILRRYFYFQGELPLCAFYTEKAVLEAYLGQVLPANELFSWYAATGTFDVAALGVPEDRIGDALKVKGFAVQHVTLTKDALKTTVTKGYAVLAEVNPIYYWAPDDPMVDFWVDLQRRRGLPTASHLVWVTDALTESVMLNDTAVQDGAGLAVPWTLFLRSWGESGNRAVVVPRVLPPLDPDGNGTPVVDGDRDGHASTASGGDDCDDRSASVHPGSPEVPYNRVDDDCAGGDAVDLDGDGYSSTKANGPDCDDTTAAVHPGAQEVCYDGVDSDCIPEILEFDCDGDGAERAPMGTDCDDTDRAIHIGAEEQCNGVDDDCDGMIDSADSGVLSSATFYRDQDGDGYGSLVDSVAACPRDRLPGYLRKSGDCDDLLSTVFPDAREACDGVDNDCDGRVDDADDSLLTEHLCYRDADGDGRGGPDVVKPACECGAGWSDRRFDCDDGDPARSADCE